MKIASLPCDVVIPISSPTLYPVPATATVVLEIAPEAVIDNLSPVPCPVIAKVSKEVPEI